VNQVKIRRFDENFDFSRNKHYKTDNNHLYFYTREGAEIGPFKNQQELNQARGLFVYRVTYGREHPHQVADSMLFECRKRNTK
jgi:hypothetical protein